LLSSEKTKEG